MPYESLKTTINALFPTALLDEGGQWPVVHLEPAAWPQAATQLRNNNDLHFDFLFCLTCIDWKTHFTIVYHFRSTVHHHTLVIKIKTDHNEPEVASIAQLWRTAEFHEREVYDLFGIRFLNHPDLRRLLLADDWTGYPLRKDYEDEINMIKL